jgi:geranylgeranyl pyrophosphate synthase
MQAEAWARQAVEALAPLPDGAHRDALLFLAQFAVARRT